MGGSPELCRILDAHGFSDLEKSISHHVALSSLLPIGDERRFEMGTPSEVMKTMKRCWEIAPSSSQIIVYAEKFKEILEKIVAAEGTIVPGEALRSGRRALNHKGDKEIQTRLRTSHRKDLLRGRDVHPSIEFIRNAILNSTDGLVNLNENITPIPEDQILDHVEILEAQFEHLNIEMGVGANLLGVIDDDSTSTAGDFIYANMHDTMQGDI